MSERKVVSRNVAIGLGIICIILIACTRTVNATIENEYTATYRFSNYPFDLDFAISVKVTIETEADNTWVVGKSYTITYTITLEDVGNTTNDQTRKADFSLVCSKPFMNEMDPYTLPLVVTVVNNSTDPLMMGIRPTEQLSMQFTPTEEKQYALEFGMYMDGGAWFNTHDSASGPTYIEAKASPFSFQPLLIVGIGIGVVVGGVAVGGAFYLHERSKSRKEYQKKEERDGTQRL